MNVLILGVGNILLSDEGIGVRAVEYLEANYELPEGVELLDGGTAGMELLEFMSRRDLVVIADCVRTGRHKPGELVRLAGDDVPAFFRLRISPHQVGLSDVLATLMIADEMPKEVVILGVIPESLETSLELTPVCAPSLPKLVDAVIAELHNHGIELKPKG